jgi:hypothetical protein
MHGVVGVPCVVGVPGVVGAPGVVGVPGVFDVPGVVSVRGVIGVPGVDVPCTGLQSLPHWRKLMRLGAIWRNLAQIRASLG